MTHFFSDKGLASLQMKRNGELLRETTSDSLSNLRAEGEPLVENKQEWPGRVITPGCYSFLSASQALLELLIKNYSIQAFLLKKEEHCIFQNSISILI